MSTDKNGRDVSRFNERFAEQVVDPDDYNRTQRFKEIHQARQRVSEFVTKMEMPDDGNSYYLKESARLAYLVALYILELEPLIVRSEFDEGDLIPEKSKYRSLRDFAARMGIQYGGSGTSPPAPTEVLQIYSAANRFYAHVGMDLELKADEGDAGFDYTDILEEGPPDDGDLPEIEEAGD